MMAMKVAMASPQRSVMRGAALAGAVLAAIVLALTFFDARTALGAWLVAFTFWSGVPIGALVFLMMIRIIPGPWEDELSLPARTAVLLMPLAAIAVLPVLAGSPALYTWTSGVPDQGIHKIYLQPWFFVLRSALFFVAVLILAALLILSRTPSAVVATIGAVLFPLLFTAVAVDWLMSLEPDFHSSVWGLYILNNQAMVALCVLIAARLVLAPRSAKVGILGGLLLVTCLLWAYFIYIQYLIVWSGNLPPKVAWFVNRSHGGWQVTMQATAAATLFPAALLLFSPVRTSRPAVLSLSVLVLLARALESIWLVVPTTSPDSSLGVVAAVLALAGVGLLFAVGFVAALPPAEKLRLGWVPTQEATAP